jgi:hypothetical protein
MGAFELIARYNAGERLFQEAHLEGADLVGADLEGTDLLKRLCVISTTFAKRKGWEYA